MMLLFMGESKGFDRFLLLFRNAVNLLDRPSLRILDLSPIQSARYLSQAFFCRREQNQRNRSKIQGYSKNERRIWRTGTKPIRGKIDLFIFESDQRTGPDVRGAPEGLGALNDYASTKPGYRRATKFRPTIEEIF